MMVHKDDRDYLFPVFVFTAPSVFYGLKYSPLKNNSIFQRQILLDVGLGLALRRRIIGV